jgi:hypothetical protein
MTLIIKDGKVVNTTDKSIDSLKRAQYGHDIITEETEGTGEIEEFLDNLEPLEDGEEDAPAEADLEPEAVEVALEYINFKSTFTEIFGEEELADAFNQIENYFSAKGVDVKVDLAGLGEDEQDEEDVPGLDSSEQSIVSSDIEEEEE